MKFQELVLGYKLVMSVLTGSPKTAEVIRAEDDIRKTLEETYAVTTSVDISDKTIEATFFGQNGEQEVFCLQRDAQKTACDQYQKKQEETLLCPTVPPYPAFYHVVVDEKAGAEVRTDPRARDLAEQVNKRLPNKAATL